MSKLTHSVPFEMKINIDFLDPKKAQAFFIDGLWSESYHKYDDLLDISEDIATAFHNATEHRSSSLGTWVRQVEGHGVFIYDNEKDHWQLHPDFHEHGGNIIVTYEEELEATHAFMADS